MLTLHCPSPILSPHEYNQTDSDPIHPSDWQLQQGARYKAQSGLEGLLRGAADRTGGDFFKSSTASNQ